MTINKVSKTKTTWRKKLMKTMLIIAGVALFTFAITPFVTAQRNNDEVVIHIDEDLSALASIAADAASQLAAELSNIVCDVHVYSVPTPPDVPHAPCTPHDVVIAVPDIDVDDDIIRISSHDVVVQIPDVQIHDKDIIICYPQSDDCCNTSSRNKDKLNALEDKMDDMLKRP